MSAAGILWCVVAFLFGAMCIVLAVMVALGMFEEIE